MEQGYSVRDRVVLVTGANRGIGKALVEAAIRNGASKVYAAVRTLSTAQPLVDSYPSVVEAIHIDLGHEETISKAAAVATDVHIVINNAGILSNTLPLDDKAVHNLEQEMQVNVYGLMHMARHFCPILKLNGGGCLVQINSVASLRCVVPAVSTYSASKAAAFSITQALRAQLRGTTLVVSVHPGPIATDLIRHNPDLAAQAAQPAVVADHVMEAIQQGEFLVFPDAKAKKLGQAYSGFGKHVFKDGNKY
jgi:NAD(P)-dependent dehydrogenase (short-subunit alcohol dehydrogenase family)